MKTSAVVWTTLGAAALWLAGTAAAAPRTLALDDGQPRAGLQLWVTDFEGEQPLRGAPVVVPKPAQPRVAESAVQARRSERHRGAAAVQLQFQKSWIAQLQWRADKPLDLRPYLQGGTLEFDLRVDELAHGGLNFKLGCGKDCERKINYLRAGRAQAGKGWKHLAYALQCFWREGDDFSAVPLPFAVEAIGSGNIALANVRLVRHRAGAKTPTTMCPDYRSIAVTPAPLEESWAVDWWLPRHEQKLKEVRAHRDAGRQVELLFLGDSITQGWEGEGKAVWAQHYAPLNAVGMGFGGDRTENLLWRLQHGALDGLSPKVVVMMIGTNNAGHRLDPPPQVASGIRRNIEEVRQRLPNSKILLLAIFPRDEKPDGLLRLHNQKVNDLIAGFADGRSLVYLDIGAAFLRPDGTLPKEVMPDLLHLSEQGYDIWARSIAPTLAAMMAP